MRVGALAAFASAALLGCSGGGDSMEEPWGTDASGFARNDGGPVSDAAPAGAAPPDAAPVPATVDANPCLYLLQGPGGGSPKVQCGADTGPFCNGANEICMPDGSMVSVTGAPVDDPNQEICTQWYPVVFRSYEGFCCGDYLVFP